MSDWDEYRSSTHLYMVVDCSHRLSRFAIQLDLEGFLKPEEAQHLLVILYDLPGLVTVFRRKYSHRNFFVPDMEQLYSVLENLVFKLYGIRVVLAYHDSRYIYMRSAGSERDFAKFLQDMETAYTRQELML